MTITTSTPTVAEADDIRLTAVGKRFGTTNALTDIDLRIPAGSLTVIVGPSGCGKSTMLRVLAGLEAVSHGTLAIGSTDVTAQAAGERDVAMVFQDYALYPHMSVAENISFGLRLARRHDRRNGPSTTEIAARTDDVARLLGLETLLARKPAQLSGGQRQRVALARAIIRRPRVLLLDEPLSALDAQLRASARAEILRLHREIESTLVLVTHDQHEALSMATHLVVMHDGRIAQSGPPEEVYRRPMTEFVASFVGSPAMNFSAEGDTRIGWRAADARIGGVSDAGGLTVAGMVEACEFTGSGQELLCTGPTGSFTLVQGQDHVGGERWLRPGDSVHATVPRDRLHRFDASGSRVDD